ncbi:MAG: STAS domain-containing protein [Roseiflexaceae bacterium]
MSSRKLASPVRLLLGALILTLGIVAWLSWSVYTSYTLLTTTVTQDVRLTELRGIILHLDEVLTMSARLAALTGDPQWGQRYNTYVPQLDAAIQEAIRLVPVDFGAQIREETDAANIKLVELETTALTAVQQGRLTDARTLLFSAEYEHYKQIYAQGMAKLLGYIQSTGEERQQTARRQSLIVLISLLILVPILSAVWVGVFKYLQATVSVREALLVAQVREQTLEQTRRAQEDTIIERTAALRDALQVVEEREAGLKQTLIALQDSQTVIRELSAPVIPVLPGVLVVPVIGELDNNRITILRENVLRTIEQHRARVVIFDITGVPFVDTQVAQMLLHTAAAVQLLGAQLVLVGIRPEVAQTIVALNIDLTSLTIYSLLQEAVKTLLITTSRGSLARGINE